MLLRPPTWIVRNGSADAEVDCTGGAWQNGNLGPENAHLVEGYSTPFRNVMTNLPVNKAITLVIGYDIKNSGGNAYDYLTTYNRLNDPAHQALFGHAPETVDPAAGVAGVAAITTTYPIPAPNSIAAESGLQQPVTDFNTLPAAAKQMTLFGGTITDVQYVTQGDLTDAQSETTIAVTFSTPNPTAVLAWGGHIAKCSVWYDENLDCLSAGGNLRIAVPYATHRLDGRRWINAESRQHGSLDEGGCGHPTGQPPAGADGWPGGIHGIFTIAFDYEGLQSSLARRASRWVRL